MNDPRISARTVRRAQGVARAGVLVVLVVADAGFAAPLATAQTEGFGRIQFPTSGSREAQPHFLRGVAALHSFEYEDALDAFRQAQALDPRFAMAYWGEAMAHNQTLWLHEDLQEARRALARLGPTPVARARLAPTPRERAYLEVVHLLVGDGDKKVRDRAYAEGMGRLAARYPDDQEAACFYALALLATVQRGITGLGSEDEHRHALVGSDVQEQAARILQDVLKANPEHPGAAHYLIHTWDDPAHAAAALPIARKYARIAPAASHALHMPAHIFVQLGLWDEAAASDEASFASSDAFVRRKALPLSMRSYHSLAWLQYEYLQQGRYGKSERTLEEIEPIAEKTGLTTLKAIAASMRARAVIETSRWDRVRGQTRFDNSDELFAIGMGAARGGDSRMAGMARDELARRTAAQQTGDRAPVVAVQQRALAALVELAAGRGSQAVGLMEQAIESELRLPPPLGPPVLIKPTNELFGEILLELGRAREAASQFEAALQRYPNRSLSLLGLGRALTTMGEHARAREQYRAFLGNWRQADPDLSELAEARQAVETTGFKSRSGGGLTPVVAVAVALAAGALVVGRRLRRPTTTATATRRPAMRKSGRRRR